MSRSKESWTWEGRKITEEKNWEFEIDGEYDLADVAATPALSKVNIDLCYRCEVVLSTHGDSFVCWRERDPKVPDSEDFFARDASGRGNQRIEQYKRLIKKHPPESYAHKITSRQAYEIIARFWLPREFHLDAGLRPAESSKPESGASRLAEHLRSLVAIAANADVKRAVIETVAWLETSKSNHAPHKGGHSRRLRR